MIRSDCAVTYLDLFKIKRKILNLVKKLDKKKSLVKLDKFNITKV